MSESPEAVRDVIAAARRVALNAYGTAPRHTRARDGGCRDDCIPCGLAALTAALDELGEGGPKPGNSPLAQRRTQPQPSGRWAAPGRAARQLPR